ncbi:MAG: DUF4837 family protein [Flavobacteriales bacterium]|jgi:hypothetical protein|nr:DUF4837 family protein [Flavobacteriales bacterium]
MPLPGITGRAGELVVVMEEHLWNQPAGDSVFNTLAQHVYGLPQAEPTFNVVHIKTSAFTKIFQTHRNLVVVSIGEEHAKSIELKKDLWATPQVVIKISAPNTKEFLDVFGNNADKIISHVLKHEQQRTLRSYNAQLNHDVVKHLKTEHGIDLSIPVGYNLVREEENFSWIRYETKDVMQSLLVFTEPYQRENTFTKEGMTKVMNGFTRKYVQGKPPGSYMKVVTEYPPLMDESSLADVYASKLVGLWDMEKELMGGPLVAYAVLDKQRSQVIYLYGFVFAPGKNKRNYVRQIDAIINSLGFTS